MAITAVASEEILATTSVKDFLIREILFLNLAPSAQNLISPQNLIEGNQSDTNEIKEIKQIISDNINKKDQDLCYKHNFSDPVIFMLSIFRSTLYVLNFDPNEDYYKNLKTIHNIHLEQLPNIVILFNESINNSIAYLSNNLDESQFDSKLRELKNLKNKMETKNGDGREIHSSLPEISFIERQVVSGSIKIMEKALTAMKKARAIGIAKNQISSFFQFHLDAYKESLEAGLYELENHFLKITDYLNKNPNFNKDRLKQLRGVYPLVDQKLDQLKNLADQLQN